MTAPSASRPLGPLPDPGPDSTGTGPHVVQSVLYGAAVNGSTGDIHIHVQLSNAQGPHRAGDRPVSDAAHAFALALDDFVLRLRFQWRRLVGPTGGHPLTPPDSPGGSGS